MVSNHKLVCARAARDEFAEDYRRGIRDYRLARGYAASCGRELQAQLPEDLPLLVLKQLRDPAVVQLAWDGVITLDNKDARTRETPFRVMARKRPLLPSEREARLYDTLSTEGANNAVVVHDGRVHRDGRTLYMVHSRFCLDRIFGASESNDTVYTDAAQPLLHAAAAGGRAVALLLVQRAVLAGAFVAQHGELRGEGLGRGHVAEALGARLPGARRLAAGLLPGPKRRQHCRQLSRREPGQLPALRQAAGSAGTGVAWWSVGRGRHRRALAASSQDRGHRRSCGRRGQQPRPDLQAPSPEAAGMGLARADAPIHALLVRCTFGGREPSKRQWLAL
mmetsp:Transcript_16217/g.50920  ORF Transcript_16217/g.50920 Transcript_16217/m.50920 type:complete len:336 (+) Transcript_16217:41-1048(+)